MYSSIRRTQGKKETQALSTENCLRQMKEKIDNNKRKRKQRRRQTRRSLSKKKKMLSRMDTQI